MERDTVKVERDGMVAVLVSHGFGAGWSTWADKDQQEFLMFDSSLIHACENGMSEDQVEQILERQFEDNPPYTGGWRDVCVYWVPIGTRFWINEYDGSESLMTIGDLDLQVA